MRMEAAFPTPAQAQPGGSPSRLTLCFNSEPPFLRLPFHRPGLGTQKEDSQATSVNWEKALGGGCGLKQEAKKGAEGGERGVSPGSVVQRTRLVLGTQWVLLRK